MQGNIEQECGNAAADSTGSSQNDDAEAGLGGMHEDSCPGAKQAPGPQLAGWSSLTPHYDPATEVVLRCDVLSSRAVKGVIALMRAVVLLGVALLVAVVYVQEGQDASWLFTHNALPITNLVCASLCTAALLVYSLFFLRRVLRVNASGKHWSHRRRRLATLASAELALQLVSTIMFLAPNTYLIAHECGWFNPLVAWSAFVRWTCWNSTFCLYVVEAHSGNPAQGVWRVERPGERGAPLVIDAPLRQHWKKALYWCLVVANSAALSTVVASHVGGQQVPPPPECHAASYNCSASGAIDGLASSQFALNLGYLLFYSFHIHRSFRHLLKLPYEEYRQANFVVRLQLRLRGLNLLFFVLTVCLYTFLGIGSCKSYMLTWLGLLPVQLVSALVAIINCFVMTPTRPHHAAILRQWLQEFAWTEAEVKPKRRQRASSLPPESRKAVAIGREPMFCVETALKLTFWSFVVYDHLEVPGSVYTLEAALQMYRLQRHELLWEAEHDVKCLVAWNDDTVVIAFRGTASLANVKVDLQAWRTRWPPGVGRPLLGTAPMIHRGFHRSWTAAGFHQRLLGLVSGIVDAAPVKPVKVLVTGHSLGGALATLCAQELATGLPGAISLQVYCFGAPRTGNHAHARMYDRAVRETWHVVNNEDVVVKSAKFIAMYKRAGHRVLINSLGDLVVRPTHAETVIRTLPGANSIRDHLLTSYVVSFAAVLGSQFGSKSFAGGREGVLRLIQHSSGMDFVLKAMGFTHDTLALLQHRGWDALLQARRQARRAPLRLPWPWSKGPTGSQGSLTAASGQQPAVAPVETASAGLENHVASAREAGALGDKQRAQQALAAVAVIGEPGTGATVAATEEPSEQTASAVPVQQQGSLYPPRPQEQHAHQPRPEQRRLASRPSTMHRLLHRASMLSSGRSVPPDLGPCSSARGPLSIAGAATPLDALVVEVGGYQPLI